MPISRTFLLWPLAWSLFVPNFTTVFARTHRVVRISAPAAENPNEVSVAIDPGRPTRVVAVSMQRNDPTTNFAYASADGGLSWTTAAGPNPESRTQGDDAVVFDASGRAYWSYISFEGLRQERPERARNGVFLNRSDDGGRTWLAPVPVVDHINTVAPFEDKPYLAVDTSPGSPHHGNVYLAWTRFSRYGVSDPQETSHIFFSRSGDRGASFSMPIRVSDAPGDAVDSDDTVEGAVPAVGPNGEVYLVWSGPQGLVLDRSLDGGWTFGEDRVLSPHPGGWDIDIEGVNRANGMPVTGVDLSDGPYRGTLYVNWIDHRNGEDDPDVFVTFSRDGGESWSDAVCVNGDATAGDGAAQFFTWMAVDPVDGSVNVVYYDRSGLRGTRTGVTLARSVDGGESFERYPLDVEPFETKADVFFGDYLGIDAYGGRVVTAFPVFVGESRLALLAGVFRFESRTQTLLEP